MRNIWTMLLVKSTKNWSIYSIAVSVSSITNSNAESRRNWTMELTAFASLINFDWKTIYRHFPFSRLGCNELCAHPWCCKRRRRRSHECQFEEKSLFHLEEWDSFLIFDVWQVTFADTGSVDLQLSSSPGESTSLADVLLKNDASPHEDFSMLDDSSTSLSSPLESSQCTSRRVSLLQRGLSACTRSTSSLFYKNQQLSTDTRVMKKSLMDWPFGECNITRSDASWPKPASFLDRTMKSFSTEQIPLKENRPTTVRNWFWKIWAIKF